MTDKAPARPNSRWHKPEQVRKIPRYTQIEQQQLYRLREQPGWRNGAKVRK